MEVCGELLDKVYHHIIGDVPPPGGEGRKRLDKEQPLVPGTQKAKDSKVVPSSAPEKLRLPGKEGSSSPSITGSSLGRPKSFSCINELQPASSKRDVIDESEKMIQTEQEKKDEDNKKSSSKTESPDQR